MTSDMDLFLDGIRNHRGKTVIYGAGLLGKNLHYFLQEECGIEADFFCDKNAQLWGKTIAGHAECLSLEELAIHKEDCSVLIAVGYRYLEEVKLFFKQNHIDKYATCFDLFKNNWMKKKFCKAECIQTVRSFTERTKEVGNTEPAENRRVAVYTFITEGYDELHQPLVTGQNVDYFVIADHKIADLGVFHWIDVNTIVPGTIQDPFIKNRYCKMHGAEIFREYDYSIYLDGALQIAGDIISYLEQTGKTGLAFYLNETSECIYETGILITMMGRCSFEMARNQLRTYALEGMPENYGLLCGGYIFRDNRNALGNELMDAWWKEYERWPTRDQLCLTYVMWKMGLALTDIGIINHGQNRLEDRNIIHHAHRYMKLYSPDREGNEIFCLKKM